MRLVLRVQARTSIILTMVSRQREVAIVTHSTSISEDCYLGISLFSIEGTCCSCSFFEMYVSVMVELILGDSCYLGCVRFAF